MNIRVVVAGKPALAYARAGVEEYLKRLGRFGLYEMVVVKAGTSAEVSRRLLERTAGCHRIALDERGSMWPTMAFHHHVQRLAMRGDVKTLAFLIGAADGHTDELRETCDGMLAVSSMTLQHELALLVLLEQLYRLASIEKNSPYHRE